jgi:ectoine hydroxylase-related dioxygenase (phytanoyl-CoA dioxygenase family)
MTALQTLPATASEVPASPYHLTAEQIRFFDANGYLLLRNWIPDDMLQRLRAASERWIARGQAAEHDPAMDADERSDYGFATRSNGKRVMWRVNYVHNKGEDASLELLGSPHVLAVAESLCGPSFVPTYESLVFKQEGDGAEVMWHQDAVHPRKYRIFNYDLYLDHSTAEGGALRVIPASQTGKVDTCAIRDAHGWLPPGVITVEMQPGDVLLHDVMVVHGSPTTDGNALRRTLYYEFRAAEEILEEGPWDREWIDRRLRLLPVALRRYAARYPAGPRFAWNIAPHFRPPASADDEAELKIAHVVHMNGSWCSAGSVG